MRAIYFSAVLHCREKIPGGLDDFIVSADEGSPKGVYLAKVHGTRGEHWEETQGTITNDGSGVVCAGNWNANVGRERPFVMQLDMLRGRREMVR